MVSHPPTPPTPLVRLGPAPHIGSCAFPPSAMVPHPCPARKAAIRAVSRSSFLLNYEGCMAMVMVAATFEGTGDEDDDDSDNVEHDVKDDLIVDSTRVAV